ncbi:N-acyl-L-homoserine lactone synthetase-like protein [Dinoroseobacter shibae DFL 12 = DSM 16493]|jgi:N-acyl-L-homoserine lactone synthetase|uniref:acyl-homoserine-lactone synthase n=1 Tax=Dinoroseobacter shibae (strain DSM 16493 / NCIMB 14021 / DFL 12) TaxID=398580 RepID=A8LM84_DINSH|nr:MULTISPECIES: acyl-homoserine-lactone synthase [Dinoroseobacter]ABV92061.1 N-acyl-L-homoserine lactone synthetase-like protein [Dinoroseobacter shibae DFL 12 = DSM 16493]MDD9718854.1 acyl-homoserine-lactone synthase [Dinoroseobacter sp. PD6]URF47025.1 N-acyl-L-homoserine lactone synthetase [Dinoroseobacter shibae]URF51336.1 N-acyl-L-homoserine lactone synthetase [Dinoroseobacter shibae]
MQTTTLSFENLHNHGELFANLFRARRQSFIVQNKWDLPEAMGMEYDQYDTPASRWVAVHEFGEVYAGIRLTPTTARCGIYTYMIRDAQMGLLDTIPQDLLYGPAPVDESVWESSRVFVSHTTPQKLRRRVHACLISEMTKAAREHGASRVLGLVPAVWTRFADRLGLDIEPAGRVMELDGIDNQCVSIDLTRKLH